MSWTSPEIVIASLNGCAVAIGTWFAFYLNNLVKLQVDAKSATIETLKTENQRLANLTSPAFAEYVTKNKAALEALANQLAETQKKYEEAENRANESVPSLEEAKIENAIVHEANESLTQQIKETQVTLDRMEAELRRLAFPGYAIGTGAVGQLAGIMSTAPGLPLATGGIDSSKKVFVPGAPFKTESPANKKKGFTL